MTTPNTAITIGRIGGPEVMEFAEHPEPSHSDAQVVIDVTAAGVNFIDTYHRTGLYPMEMPFTPGLEGAGTISSAGASVSDFAVGDRVAWTGSIGSYATTMVADPDRLVQVPDGVDLKTAAAAMLQGLTAHYLATDTFELGPEHTALIHAGAGGVGLILTQIAKMKGATVFTTVGTGEKADLSRAAGADHVILYRDRDFSDEVRSVAGDRPVDVVYDGVGKTTFDGGLALLKPRGMMVTFGNASGPVDPVSPLALSQNGSLFLTRPKLFDHIPTPESLRARTGDLFEWIGTGALGIRIGGEYRLAEAAEAHRALEGRLTTGKVLLIP